MVFKAYCQRIFKLIFPRITMLKSKRGNSFAFAILFLLVIVLSSFLIEFTINGFVISSFPTTIARTLASDSTQTNVNLVISSPENAITISENLPTGCKVLAYSVSPDVTLFDFSEEGTYWTILNDSDGMQVQLSYAVSSGCTPTPGWIILGATSDKLLSENYINSSGIINPPDNGGGGGGGGSGGGSNVVQDPAIKVNNTNPSNPTNPDNPIMVEPPITDPLSNLSFFEQYKLIIVLASILLLIIIILVIIFIIISRKKSDDDSNLNTSSYQQNPIQIEQSPSSQPNIYTTPDSTTQNTGYTSVIEPVRVSANPEAVKILKNFIANARTSKIPDAQIFSALLGKGWKQADINEATKQLAN